MKLGRGRRPLALALLLAAIAGTTLVIACGPDFPPQLLDDRKGTLLATPSDSFDYEASHLVPVDDKLKAVESSGNDAPPTDSSESSQEQSQDQDSNTSGDSDEAEAGYANALDLYKAAMQDYGLAYVDDSIASPFEAMQRHLDAIARAQRGFQALLDLPPEIGAVFAVDAAYMLARIQERGLNGPGRPAVLSDRYDADSANKNATTAAPLDPATLAARNIKREQGAQAFERVRELARAGADDGEGLAVASYGEEARMFLDGPYGPCSYSALLHNAPCLDAIPPADMKRAIRLYAAQAAHDSDSGRNSLNAIAAWALGDAARVRRLYDDPVALRLLTAYVLASANDYFGDIRFEPDVQVNLDRVLSALADGLAALPAGKQDGADRFAALAYGVGRFDLAAKLTKGLETPMAWWVQAKIALRRGDSAAAAAAYARAIQAFPQNADNLSSGTRSTVRAEQAVLSLSRGQYLEALDQLYRALSRSSTDEGAGVYPAFAAYWNDVAYIAERVLTTEELRAYVDAHVPASPVPKVDMTHMDENQQDNWRNQHPAQAADMLRDLLARRLMRDGLRTQALPYFPADDDPRFVTGESADSGYVYKPSRLRQVATGYDELLRQAHDAWRGTTQAQAWYRAAQVAREKGMDLLGYEQDPDYAFSDGFYTYGVGRNGDANVRYAPHPVESTGSTSSTGLPGAADSDHSADAADSDSADSTVSADPASDGELANTPALRAARDLPGPYVTEEERRRYAASEARPYARFHYREIAADHAIAAADVLPPHSQAYAATLCQAARYVMGDDPDRAASIYKRYVKTGAVVPFGATFGRECPEPDFRAAERFPYVQAWRMVRRHPIVAALAGAATLAALAALIMGAVRLRRRHRAA